VWNRANNTLAECSPELCPKAEGGVNYAPFFAEGGESYSINADAKKPQKELVIEFLAWLSTLSAAEIPLSGQFSVHHTTPEYIADFSDSSGWPPIMITDLLEGVLPKIFATDGNQAQDLLIQGYSEYMAVLREELYDRFLLDPKASDLTVESDEFDTRYDTFATALKLRLDAVTIKYGRLRQLKQWRNSLNLPEVSDLVLCASLSSYNDSECAVLARDRSPIAASITPAGGMELENESRQSGDGGDDAEKEAVLTAVIVSSVAVILLVGAAGVLVTIARERRRSADLAEKIRNVNERVRRVVAAQFSGVSSIREAESRFEALIVTKEQIDCGEELGRGAFGVVFRGKLRRDLNRPVTNVAVKQLAGAAVDDVEEQQAFLFEARLLAMMNHPGIVKVLAVQVATRPLMLACELLEGGDLLGCLRRGPCPPLLQSLTLLHKVAAAVQYLHTLHIVHRDLAARNVLVGSSITDVRVSDFGLSRRMAEGKEYYRKVSGDKIPVRWLPLESIQYKKYSPASDVWSFGVLGWEIFSGGQRPWALLSPVETVLAVAQGFRLQRPQGCPVPIHEIFLDCWSQHPEARPTVASVAERLIRAHQHFKSAPPEKEDELKASEPKSNSNTKHDFGGTSAGDYAESSPDSSRRQSTVSMWWSSEITGPGDYSAPTPLLQCSHLRSQPVRKSSNSAVRHATTLPAEADASCARRNSQLDPRYSSYEYESQDEMARRISTFYGIQFDPTDKSTSSSQEARRSSIHGISGC